MGLGFGIRFNLQIAKAARVLSPMNTIPKP